MEDLSSTFSTLAISSSHTDQLNPALFSRTQLNYIGALPIGSTTTNHYPTPNTTPSCRDVLCAFSSAPPPKFGSPIVNRSVGLDFASFGVTAGPSYPGFKGGPDTPEQSVPKPPQQLQHQQHVLKPNTPSKLSERSLQKESQTKAGHFQSLFDQGLFYFGVISVNVLTRID